jgi:hypothetical protein
MPVWFGFAPYASLVVGKGEIALGLMLHALEDKPASFWDYVPIVSQLSDAEDFVQFVKDLMGVFSYGGDSGNMEALLSARVIARSAKRAATIIANEPDDSLIIPDLKMRAMSMLSNLRNALERGNRLIYTDVGGMGQSFLHYRKDRQPTDPTPTEVLDEFSTQMGTTAEYAHTAYDFAIEHLDDSPIPTDFSVMSIGGDDESSAACAVAGLALYEAASREVDDAKANKYILFGNNLLAYREQYYAVQPAFNMELPTFELMTPTVNLKMRGDVIWTFNDYMTETRDDLLNYNWGRFNDRWTPILDAFRLGYASYPGSIWPLPHPDPH